MRKVLTLAFSIAVSVAFAQDANKVKSNSGKTEQKAQAADMNTPYMGLEEKLRKYLVSGEIPADFPKFDAATMNKEVYWKMITSWGMQNKTLVKPEYHKELEDRYRRHKGQAQN